MQKNMNLPERIVNTLINALTGQVPLIQNRPMTVNLLACQPRTPAIE
jgi:hypothetical protein